MHIKQESLKGSPPLSIWGASAVGLYMVFVCLEFYGDWPGIEGHILEWRPRFQEGHVVLHLQKRKGEPQSQTKSLEGVTDG